MLTVPCRGAGIKEATGDVSRVAAIQGGAGKDFLLYSGDDETGAEFVLKGGHGVISVTTNVVRAHSDSVGSNV